MPQVFSFALFCFAYSSIRRTASIPVVYDFLLFFGVELCVSEVYWDYPALWGDLGIRGLNGLGLSLGDI